MSSTRGKKGVAGAVILFVTISLHLITRPLYSLDNKFSIIKIELLDGLKNTQSKKYDQAIAHFDKIKDLDDPLRGYVLFFLGKALHQAGRCAEARGVFKELIKDFPESRWVPMAKVQAVSSGPCPPFEQPREKRPQDDCEDLSRKKNQADCYFRSRRYAKAAPLYKDLATGEKGRRGIFFLEHLSQAASRTQDFETAIAANQTLRERYPHSSAASQALHNIAFLYEDSGDFRSALPLWQTLAEQDRRHSYFYEKIGWAHLRLGEYAEAIEGFDGALSRGKSPFSLYWKGRSLEKMGKTRAAREIWRQLVKTYPQNYYGLRALERLYHGTLKSVLQDWWMERPGKVRWVPQNRAIDRSKDLQRIDELRSVGLLEDAAVEVRRTRAHSGQELPSDPRKIRKTPDGFSFSTRLPQNQDPDFPLLHADLLFSEIKRQGVASDPFLIYAMMRQESRFSKSARSHAAAMGLMQIIPETGKRLAQEAGWPDFETDWLYDPVTNIELAVRYLGKLHDLFSGRWYAITAGYNAGEEVVAVWLRQRGGLSEEAFIEEIPYRETREYVKKVYVNWKAYRYLYGAD